VDQTEREPEAFSTVREQVSYLKNATGVRLWLLTVVLVRLCLFVFHRHQNLSVEEVALTVPRCRRQHSDSVILQLSTHCSTWCVARYSQSLVVQHC